MLFGSEQIALISKVKILLKLIKFKKCIMIKDKNEEYL